MQRFTNIMAATSIAALLPAALSAATATIQDLDGADIGTVEVTETASGQAHVAIELQGLPAGEHGVHVHETGDCSADDFTSAGGHLAMDRQHGVMVDGGPHPGDLPNVTAVEGQPVTVEYFSDLLTMDAMFDDDGSAFVVHANADDYESQPSGDAGDRIACGVFEE